MTKVVERQAVQRAVRRAVDLVSDGVFHAASTVLPVVGVAAVVAGNGRAVFADRAERGAAGAAGRRLWGGVLVGLGGFNLYDATVQHKLLRLHQVRPAADDWLPYDLAFGGLATALLLAGLLLLRSGRGDARAGRL